MVWAVMRFPRIVGFPLWLGEFAGNGYEKLLNHLGAQNGAAE